MSSVQRLHGTSIKRVIVIGKDQLGRVRAETIARKGSGKPKKQSMPLKFVERLLRRATRGTAEGWSEYRRLHRKSSIKRRDGALRDYPVNMLRASSKGFRSSRCPRLFW